MLNKKICLFLTYEGSLKKWDESGILDREVSLYLGLIKQGAKVAFFTYGNQDDYNYRERLPQIEIIPAYATVKKPKNRKSAFLQSWWLPIKFRKVLKKYDIYKTNQMWGGWVALMAKFVCGGKLLARCGFEHYYVLLAEKFPFRVKWWFYLISKIKLEFIKNKPNKINNTTVFHQFKKLFCRKTKNKIINDEAATA